MIDLLTVYMGIFFIALLIGVIEELNSKLVFWIWLCCVIYSIINIFCLGGNYNLYTNYGFSNWHWLGFIVVYLIGEILGNLMVNLSMDKTRIFYIK